MPSESLDLAEENWGWAEASPAERERIFRRYWSHNEGFLWFLQHDEAVPETLRQEASAWGLPKDEFTDHRHRPWQLYVREGRRLTGLYTFTERDAEHPAERPDSIAVAEFPFDSHGVHTFDPAHPGVREGYYFITHPPLDLPYGVLVPERVDGLLVPVACSASRVGYQSIRVEPTFMALGEAAGVAAAMASAQGLQPRAVPIQKLRVELRRRGAVLHLGS